MKNKALSKNKFGRMNKISNETVQYRGDVSPAPIYTGFVACINCFVILFTSLYKTHFIPKLKLNISFDAIFESRPNS